MERLTDVFTCFRKAAKYGKISGFYLGNIPVVLLSDFHQIKEAFKNDALSARPSFPFMEDSRPGSDLMNWDVNGGMPGIIFTHGKYWKELRRFMLRHLRDFGFGKTSMEELFLVEVGKLCKLLEKSEGKSFT